MIQYCHQMATGDDNMRRRIKKKKGLLPDPEYEKIKKCWMAELDRKLNDPEEIHQNVNYKDKIG